MNKDNIILIGMPGAGKSTVGVVLAKKLGYDFVDSDLVIQSRAGKLLHEIIEEQGVEAFWAVEEETNASIDVHGTVIATCCRTLHCRRWQSRFRARQWKHLSPLLQPRKLLPPALL